MTNQIAQKRIAMFYIYGHPITLPCSYAGAVKKLVQLNMEPSSSPGLKRLRNEVACLHREPALGRKFE